MMGALDELYQEMILDHYKHPRNRRPLPDADHAAEGHNPLCGDHVQIFLKLDGDRVQDVAFEGGGCAIATASASIMTESVKGKTLAEAKAMFKAVHRMLMGDQAALREDHQLGKLEVFSSVCRYPARVKCATLSWHTLDAALAQKPDTVTTE